MAHPLPKAHPLYMQMLEYEIKQHPRNASYDLVAQFGPKNYIQYKRWCDSRGYTPDAHQILFPLTQDAVEDEYDEAQARKLLKILHPTDGLYLKKQLAQYLSPLWGAWEYRQDSMWKKQPIWVLTDEFPKNFFISQHWEDNYDAYGEDEEDLGDWDKHHYEWEDLTREDFKDEGWYLDDDEWPEYYGGTIRLNPTSITVSVTEYDESDDEEWEHKEYLKLHHFERLSDIIKYVWWDWIDMKEENPYLYNAKIIYDTIGYDPKLQQPEESFNEWDDEAIVFFPTRKMPAETLKQLRRAAYAEVKDIMANL